MTKKTDPRAIRTQEMLKNAALDLLAEGNTINELSVQKVTKKALLNRTTFYLHYEDIHQLVTSLMKDVLDELTIKMEALFYVKDIDNKKCLIQLLDYLYTKRHYLLNLFQLEQFEMHLFQLMKQLIEIRRINSVNPSKKIRVDINIKVASLVGVIMWWLKSGLHLSSDYIAEQIQQQYRS